MIFSLSSLAGARWYAGLYRFDEWIVLSAGITLRMAYSKAVKKVTFFTMES